MSDTTGRLIVLFGAPTTGKDTVTDVLTGRNSKFEHFIKHKRGAGSRHGYTMVTESELDELRQSGRIVSQVDRYGSTYAIDRNRLATSAANDRTAIIHSAEVLEVEALHRLGGAVVILECSRDTAQARLGHRDPTTVAERMKVWDAVNATVQAVTPIAALRLSSDSSTPDDLADAIESLAHSIASKVPRDDPCHG